MLDSQKLWPLRIVRVVRDHDGRHVVLGCEPGNHRRDVDEAVGRLESDHAVGLEMTQIGRERFACEEVHRYRVARRTRRPR